MKMVSGQQERYVECRRCRSPCTTSRLGPRSPIDAIRESPALFPLRIVSQRPIVFSVPLQAVFPVPFRSASCAFRLP